MLHSQQPGSAAIQKLFFYDYRQTGAATGTNSGKQLIGVDADGNVRGFTVSDNIKQFQVEVQSEAKLASDEILDLNKKKIELLNELNDI